MQWWLVESGHGFWFSVRGTCGCFAYLLSSDLMNGTTSKHGDSQGTSQEGMTIVHDVIQLLRGYRPAGSYIRSIL